MLGNLVTKIRKTFGDVPFEDRVKNFGFIECDKTDNFLNMYTVNITGKINSKIYAKNDYLISTIKYLPNGSTFFSKIDLVIYKKAVNKLPKVFAPSDSLRDHYEGGKKSERIKSLNLIQSDTKNPYVLSTEKIDLPNWFSSFNYGYFSIEVSPTGICASMPHYYDLSVAINKLEEAAHEIF